MRVIGNLPIVKITDNVFPFNGAIKNETSTEQGTPVVAEIYNDPLMNMYRILELVGITPNDLQDNDDNGYQLVEAFRKLPNLQNDIEQVLSLSSGVWNINLNLSILPNKYFCFARPSDDYSETISANFKGTGELELPFTSIGGFSAGDELLLIIDTSGVRAYSLNRLTQTPNEIFTVLGSPIAFNDLQTLFYKESGYLITDTPSSTDIQNLLRVFASSGTLFVNDVFIHNNLIVCFCFDSDNNAYYLYDIDINNFSNITLNKSFWNDTDTDLECYSYMDLNGNIYITNKGNANDGLNDYDINKYTRDGSGIFQFVSTVSLDVAFEKTTNAVIKSNHLFTFVGGYLNKFNLATGTKTEIMYIPSINGQLFQLNGEIYFTSGEVAKKWSI